MTKINTSTKEKQIEKKISEYDGLSHAGGRFTIDESFFG